MFCAAIFFSRPQYLVPRPSYRPNANGQELKADPIPFLCIVKILILHQHFKVPGRGGAIRSYYLAKALTEKGAKVVVITAENYPDYRKECVEGIEIHYLPVAYDNRFGFTRRAYAFYRYMVKAVKFAGDHRDADLCYAISTPLTTGLAARRIRERYGIPYIFEVGDLWPDAPVEMGFVRNSWLRRQLYRMEEIIYRDALSIVALSPAIREIIRRKIQGKDVHLLPNMADTRYYEPEEKRPALEKKFGVAGRFVVSYIGAIGVANGLHYFLECALASAHAELPVTFLLCGDGAMLGTLKREAAELGLENLTFIPFRNREGVREVMNVTDATFISYQPFPILETGSPNKYFDGLAAGKLIVVNFGGWIREEIEREGCGVYVNPRSPADFVRVIRPFIEDRQLLHAFQRSGRTLAERLYSREILTKRFEKIVREAYQNHKGP